MHPAKLSVQVSRQTLHFADSSIALHAFGDHSLKKREAWERGCAR